MDVGHPGANARAKLTHGCEIVSTGFSYPSDVVDNAAFFERCQFDIQADQEALIRDSAMVQRTWCGPGENTWTMAREAAAMAMEGLPDGVEDIDVVLVSSCSTIPMVHVPDSRNPVVADLAPLLQREFDLEGATAMDIKATYCAGFIRCMQIMDTLLQNPNYETGLIVASDVGGRFATARSNKSAFCFIVGDAAGAVVLRKTERRVGAGLLDYVGATHAELSHLTSFGPDGRSLLVRGRQAGAATLDMMLQDASTLLSRNGLTMEDVSWLVPMQTHAQTVAVLLDRLNCRKNKCVWSGGHTGYAASASIPACFAKNVASGKIKKGDLVLSLAVGAGLNSGAALYHA